MFGIIGGVINLINVQIKYRPDSISDQICRVFLVRLLLCGTIIVGLNWYRDRVSCIVSRTSEMHAGFVSDACWIQGFYIYPELESQSPKVMAYYGIPVDIRDDGMYKDNKKLCNSEYQEESCGLLEKQFFLQYQYMPFIMALFTACYYIPYIFFKKVNEDILRLKEDIIQRRPEEIFAKYFNRKKNKRIANRGRVFLNIGVKILYILSSVAVFLIADGILYGNFRNLGARLHKWGSLDNHEQHAYRESRTAPKPGNVLLPTFGICDIREGAGDKRSTIINKHKYICEFSQHILYQYVFVMIWYSVVIGFSTSILGLLVHLIDHLQTHIVMQRQGDQIREIYRVITAREYQYLRFIRKKNFVLFGFMATLLRKTRFQNFDGAGPIRLEDREESPELAQEAVYDHMENNEKVF